MTEVVKLSWSVGTSIEIVFKIILRIHRNDEMYSTKIRFATLYLISLSDLSVHDGGKSKTCASNA